MSLAIALDDPYDLEATVRAQELWLAVNGSPAPTILAPLCHDVSLEDERDTWWQGVAESEIVTVRP